MDKKELIEKIESLPSLTSITSIRPYVDKKIVLGLISQLDEPQPVKVPQFVADFITEQKKLGHTLSYSIDASMSDRVAEWYWDNSELFARAWLDGYEVEKEPKYTVRVKGVNGYGCYLNKGLLSKKYFFESKAEIGGCRTKHTRKELEADGFGWVFDCEGIEVKEVE